MPSPFIVCRPTLFVTSSKVETIHDQTGHSSSEKNVNKPPISMDGNDQTGHHQVSQRLYGEVTDRKIIINNSHTKEAPRQVLPLRAVFYCIGN